MNKLLTFGSIAVLTATTATSSAQQRLRGRPNLLAPSAENLVVLADARIGEIKGVLNLTLAQEQHWPAVENALRDLLKTSIDQKRKLREDARPGEVIAGLRLKSDMMASRAAGLRKVLDAAEPLNQSLDEAQRRRLMLFLRMQMARKKMMGSASRE